MGVLRLRTGIVRFDWADTSIVAGQDSLFFAPLVPTSLATDFDSGAFLLREFVDMDATDSR